MLAGIDNRKEMNIFLTQDEAIALKSGEVTGTIVYLHEPSRQGSISVSVDDGKMDRKSRGAYLEAKDDSYRLFMTGEKKKNFDRNGIAVMTYGTALNHYRIYVVDGESPKGSHRLIMGNIDHYITKFGGK